MNGQQKRLGAFPFIIGGMSFIPLIGVPFGVIAIIWGFVTGKAGGRTLALVGCGGIASTIILYLALFYFGFVQRGGVYDDLRKQLSETTITSLVQSVEFYRVQNGNYPESLETLHKFMPEAQALQVFDPARINAGEEPGYYHYELIDADHYCLLGVGADGCPFTEDDILPKIETGPESKVGWVRSW